MAEDKNAKKEERAAKRARRKENWAQLWQAFQMQRKQDSKLVPLMLLAVIGTGVLFFLIGLLWRGQWFMLVTGLLLGVAIALWIFSRRLQNNVYNQAAGQPGAAGWALENMRSGVGLAWRTKSAVAYNTHMDIVHRVVGVGGIVLVGEGEPHRLRPLFQQQQKRLRRLAPGVPINTMIVGDGENQVPLRKLQSKLMKMERKYKKEDVYFSNNEGPRGPLAEFLPGWFLPGLRSGLFSCGGHHFNITSQ